MKTSKYQKIYDERREGTLNKSIRAGKWLAIDFVIRKLLQFAPFVILARLLTPQDFGAIAIIMLVPRFLQAASDTGLATAIIHRGSDPEKYLNSIWTLNLIRAVLIAIIVFLAGPWIAKFYNADYIAWPIRLGGIFIVVSQLANIGEIWFTKEMDFKKIFIRNTAKTLAYVVVSISVAFIYPNYWALVIGTFALHITETISTYILHPYRPKISFAFKKLKELVGYSKWMVGQVLVDQIYAFFESSIIARMTNPTSLGFYSKAKSTASIGPGSIASIITMISLPAYAKIKDSNEKIVDGLKKSLDLLFVLVMPVIVAIIIGGGKIIEIILGEQWLPMTNALRILIVYFTITSVVDISYRLYTGIGLPDKKVKLDLIKIAGTVVLLLLLIPRYGINGAAAALLIGFVPIFLINLYFLRSAIAISYWTILVRILSPLSLSIIVFSPFIVWKDSILSLHGMFVLLIVAFVLALYTGVIWIIGVRYGRGPYKTVRLILKMLPNV